MIQKKGRKAYDSDVPRVPENGIPLRLPPDEYISRQGYINSNNGFINDDRLIRYLQKLETKGFVKTNNIYELSPGDRMAYITKDGKWRSGGFVIGLYESNMVYNNFDDSIDFDIDDSKFRGTMTENIKEKIKKQIKEQQRTKEYLPFLLYKAFNNAVFSLQGVDVYEFWYKKKISKRIRKKIVKEPKKIQFNLPKNPTYYPVYLLNDNNEEVIVFYGRDTYDVKRFINSQKYSKALEQGWEFVDGTQGSDTQSLKVNLKNEEENSQEEDSEEYSQEEDFYDGEETKFNN